MNHLAHCWLARGNEGLVAGGFLGDFYKGPIRQDLPADLQNGIRLHRYIDSLTNQLPEMRSTYSRFGPELRRVAPILLDLVADHLLARHWNEYGCGELSDFTSSCYRIISQYEIPDSGKYFFRHLVSRNLWCEYTDFNVVLSVMCRILTRLNLEDRATHLTKLEPKLDDFHQDFREYFPILEDWVKTWRARNSNAARTLDRDLDGSDLV